MRDGLSLAIVGIDYPNKQGPGRRFELAICVPGEPVNLVLEPRNAIDPNAVAVFSCRGVQLGYLRAERAPLIASMLRNGRLIEAIFQGLQGNAGWARVAFDGSVPTLSPSQDVKPAIADDPDSGFRPDPIWDDE